MLSNLHVLSLAGTVSFAFSGLSGENSASKSQELSGTDDNDLLDGG